MTPDDAYVADLKERATWDDQLGQMLEQGWPLTKASYLVALSMGQAPDFPLDAETRASIPQILRGSIPRNHSEYVKAWELIPKVSPPPKT